MIQEQQALQPLTTMGVHAFSRYFAEIHSVQDLNTIMERKPESVPVMILGGGSNVLFASDYDGLMVHNRIRGIQQRSENKDEVLLTVGAGENWHQLVMHCVENGWGGIENLALIPGSVGAAPIQNIGAYGVELVDVFVELEAFELSSGLVKTFSKEECQFGYRNSIFKHQEKGKWVIISVTLRLLKQKEPNIGYAALQTELEQRGIHKPTIKQVSEAVIAVRQSKLPDPAKIGNTGSFFKNPVVPLDTFNELNRSYPELPHYPIDDASVKIPAGWLIEQAGWKGKRVGNTGTYKKQALVIVNYGEATGQEIWAFAKHIQSSVNEMFGVELEPEVNVIK
ncbi:MAG: UDP-N-acetylmuramate dehydrogenase [Bacteroidota bacterium]